MANQQPNEATTAVVSNRWRSRLTVALFCLLCAIGSVGNLSSQEPLIDREAKIKAAYLYKFIRYVQWPDAAFDGPDSPIVIGTVGADPVNQYLMAIAKHRSAGDRRLIYQSVTSANQAKKCHILFVSDNIDPATLGSILPSLRDEPVLLVGEHPSFLSTGGIISFYVVNNNIRLQLSLTSAAKHQLKISSQLAKLAQIVN